jgi:hypothetical protein
VSATTKKRIQVYICPEPGCGNYYGSASMPDLSKRFSGPKLEDTHKLAQETGSPVRHSRAACPDCRQRGKAVERVLVSVDVDVPVVGPPTPPLPASVGLAKGT